VRKRYENPKLRQRLVDLTCIIHPGTPATLHHTRKGAGTGQRRGDHRALPLCPYCHQTGPPGDCIEKGEEKWEAKNGNIEYWLVVVHKAVGFIYPEGDWL
jgi:hypothetical protein